jgi:hypothetical protein
LRRGTEWEGFEREAVYSGLETLHYMEFDGESALFEKWKRKRKAGID